MFSKVLSGAVMGIDAMLIEVQCDLTMGLPAFNIVGLPEKEVQESRERIRSAIKNSGYDFPAKRITVNLAPADLKKEGVGLDLPLALGILRATEQLEDKRAENLVAMGELSLNGELRSIKGTLPVALACRELGIKRMIVPEANAKEAAVVEGIEVYGVKTLAETVQFLQGERTIAPHPFEHPALSGQQKRYDVDMSEIRGQEQAKRALEIAAAGGHNVLMVGPPGSGKSMLATRLPSILPELNFEESLEVTKIYSIMGLLSGDQSLITQRAFRSPHHTISYAGMVGGGHGFPRPGEISLAHCGVLFLDELPEFERPVLETLRQPLEEREITISRAASAVTFPANFTLVAAMNPCPCGHVGDPAKRCRCSPVEIRRYRKRISGPFLDRIDLFVEVPRLSKDELMGKPAGVTSEEIRKRVVEARRVQQERFSDSRLHANAQMGIREIRKYCLLEDEAKKLLERAIDLYSLSARAYGRVLKVARTIADLDGVSQIGPAHVAEAIQYRSSLEILEGGE
ncbi:YifB family Mg chelatase-like AAA ATPase [Candidatus Acetothermia bacterium]|nr:YifB family Mg chelatase-like AAA ATPase [Candidatus Acetothermia bacterium]MBI3642521.1 YifB family Mg chelatase-like AAA ATPase [Candidatus Acetothermia bacterium]